MPQCNSLSPLAGGVFDQIGKSKDDVAHGNSYVDQRRKYLIGGQEARQ